MLADQYTKKVAEVREINFLTVNEDREIIASFAEGNEILVWNLETETKDIKPSEEKSKTPVSEEEEEEEEEVVNLTDDRWWILSFFPDACQSYYLL